MCGVVGIVGFEPANLALYDALTVLQHRGQDAAGIVTLDGDNFRQRKANGLVQDVFEQKHMRRLRGNIGIGHVRYPTAGSSSAAEAQPFYVNSPYGIALAHNGNLTNARELQELCAKVHRHVNTSSDSETLLNVFAWQLTQCSDADRPAPEEIFKAVRGVNSIIKGAYAVVSLIIGVGLVAFRDPRGTGDGAYLSLRTANVAVSPSGDYENYYMIEGTRYCHIIDPDTGRPINNGIATASCVGGDAGEDDARTTAICTMTPAEAVAYINREDIKAMDLKMSFVVVSGDNKYVVTNMRPEEYTLAAGFTLASTVDEQGNVSLTVQL